MFHKAKSHNVLAVKNLLKSTLAGLLVTYFSQAASTEVLVDLSKKGTH
jgi:hypothetical protein